MSTFTPAKGVPKRLQGTGPVPTLKPGETGMGKVPAPQASQPLAPAAPETPSGNAPAPSADESALKAGLAAGPQAGRAEHAAMTRPAHNLKPRNVGKPAPGTALGQPNGGGH